MRILSSLALALLLVSTIPAARAQSATPQPGADSRLTEEVAGIHRALNRLIQLLEATEVRNDADLMLRRIALMERRVAPLQSRFGSARSEVDGLESEMNILIAGDVARFRGEVTAANLEVFPAPALVGN